jgi:serine/threonine protein kinase
MNSREVRLILIENVPGISMQNLSPSNFTKSERQAIMKALIDSETALYNREIVHRDIHPRNILVLPQPSDHARKVVLVDFGLARTSRSPFPEWEVSESRHNGGGCRCEVARDEVGGGWDSTLSIALPTATII